MRKWLKEAREKKGLTMKEIGHTLGISEGYYCFIENDARKKKMDITLAVKLSDVLDIPLDRIVRMELEREASDKEN